MTFFSWLAAAIGHRRTAIGSGLRKPIARSRKPPRFRPRLESLEDRSLPSTLYAATAADLIADIKAANLHGGANTIVLTAPTTPRYYFQATDNTKDGANVLPVIAPGDALTIQSQNGSRDTIMSTYLYGPGRLFDVAQG